MYHRDPLAPMMEENMRVNHVMGYAYEKMSLLLYEVKHRKVKTNIVNNVI